MKTKQKHLISLVIISIILLGVLITLVNPLKRDVWALNASKLKEKILSVEQGVETVNLTSLTPFEWDTVYSFYPYTSKERIYSVIGYKWNKISETVNEGMNQFVFFKGGKVVCYVYGYPSNNGYYILFDPTSYKEGVATFKLQDSLNFKVRKSDEVFYLEQVK